MTIAGWPAPEVKWWRGSTLLANHSLVLGHETNSVHSTAPRPNGLVIPPTTNSLHLVSGVGQVRTELSIPALTRDYVEANLTCRASNNNITEPLTTSLALLLYRQYQYH